MENNRFTVSKIIYFHGLPWQWLRLPASSAEGKGSIPGWRSSTCHEMWQEDRKKEIIFSEDHNNCLLGKTK